MAGFLGNESAVPGVTAVLALGRTCLSTSWVHPLRCPTCCQIGSLPYSFASHFAPAALEQAVEVYRSTYQPSARHPEPYVVAAVNVTAADTQEDAEKQFEEVCRNRVRVMAARGRTLTEEELDMLIDSPRQQILQMLHYSAVGTPDSVGAYLDRFTKTARADELMISLQSPSTEQSLRSMELLAQEWMG